MGSGDWLMASALAKALHQTNGVPVMLVNRFGKAQWDPILDHNPRLTKDPRGRHQRMLNAPNNRPYIAAKTQLRWFWRRVRPEGMLDPGEIYLTDEEKAFAEPWRGRVLIEPNIKGTNGNNKAWTPGRWQQVVDKASLPFVQVGGVNSDRLRGVQFAQTPTFRHAAAVLSVSSAFVGSEGGLHHAAAALGVPAVVLFGGFISPDITGYAAHRNLFTGGRACGSRLACDHCREAMARITVDEVISNLKEAYEERTRLDVAGPRSASECLDGASEESVSPPRSTSLPGEEAVSSHQEL